ncbi:MAG: NAD-glutamate dehydrogenase [Alphaproteobacteria bacterium]|nr:NAD-glutamate dehydrogenase [Alphaproteobacteria bacterium]
MDTAVRGDLAISESDFVARAASGPYPAFKEGGALGTAAQRFLMGMYEDATADELTGLSTDDLIALSHEFWLWRGEAGGDEQKVRIRAGVGAGGRPIGRDILEIYGPDMPFLVDSVMGEISDQGVSPLALFHPIVHDPARAGAESMIQVHLPPSSPQKTQALHAGVRQTLADVRIAVSSYAAMKRRMMDCADELARAVTTLPRETVSEAVALLRWLAGDRFTFLGARDYAYPRDASGKFLADEPIILENSGIGVLADPERYVLRTSNEPLLLTPEIQKMLGEPDPLIVAKSTMRSRVHRRVTADYIGVKRYGPDGEVTGETRFVGLFASDAYIEMTRDIPMLRRKVEWVIEKAAYMAGGHNAKTLRKTLESYPRDELWQISREEMLRIARGVLHLLDRPRARAFNRRDPFNRFVTSLVYLPKDRFNSTVREAVGRRLERAYGGRVDSYYPQLGEGPMARVLFVISDIDRNLPDPNQEQLDDDIAALTRTWEDGFDQALVRSTLFNEAAREDAGARFRNAFSAAYREAFPVDEALCDVREIQRGRADETVRVRAYRRPEDAPDRLRCKIYARGEALPLSATVPILEHMGLYIESELNYRLDLFAGGAAADQVVFIHDLDMRASSGAALDFAKVEAHFEAAFTAIWTGAAESDGFNRLILSLGCSWREAALLRALCRYRQQSGLDPSQAVQEDALSAHPEIAALLLAMFRVRFDPALPEGESDRTTWLAQLDHKIEAALNAVASLDEDRALRRLARLIHAIVRTNYYQSGAGGAPKAWMSFKIDSRALEHLPAPKPFREIWVAGPEVEGVHLRFGAVARGGLRWSDRRDDFRTEVLDLVKAQQVKNAIIVPVGAKGGFYPKRLPPRGAPGWLEAGQSAYRTFLRGLLDITDNIAGADIFAPKDVVRWDADDPYLVVAADKGTATFSDIANAISEDYGHWLGDAFASGGSVGYDHKAMGITARGAWEAVKRHFREMGKNIQEEPFTAIGVGDMSGDVFGNGMLLSQKTRLIAAFDHRDIFIDPNPADLDATWAERKRLFDMPRSSWKDYDASLISQGGGVFSRTLKSVQLTAEIQEITGLSQTAVTPAELISALLKAPCELLWFGGIGTYVKAKSESNEQVGDKANDGLRVNAEDLRACVIGEGANLGVTQAGRIAFARHKREDGGGRINTDAVDNSAGVDTSDHEVNIKILLKDALESGVLSPPERNPLLADMTDDVANLVLADNYDQTLALTLSQATAAADLDSHERLMQRLERTGKLDRAVEGLPSSEDIRALRDAGAGLTRPELAKLVAYAKIDLFDALVASDAPDDPHFEASLVAYFPPQLQRFETSMRRHRLRREIIATALADDLVNMGGPSFVDRVRETARAKAVDIACAFEAARRIFRLDELSGRINALDNRAPAELQTQMHLQVVAALRRLTVYLVRRAPIGPSMSVGQTIAAYRDAVDAQRDVTWASLTALERERAEARRDDFRAHGAPDDVAGDAALVSARAAGLDIADAALKVGWPVDATAFAYRAIGETFALDRLRSEALSLTLSQHWDRLAMRRASEDLFEIQRLLAEAAIAHLPSPPRADKAWAMQGVARWAEALGAVADPVRRTMAELEEQGPWTFAKLMIATAEMRALASAIAH